MERRPQHRLSAAKIAEIDKAIGHAQATLAIHREFVRMTLKSIALLREVKASGRMSATDAAEVAEVDEFWKLAKEAFSSMGLLPDARR